MALFRLQLYIAQGRLDRARRLAIEQGLLAHTGAEAESDPAEETVPADVIDEHLRKYEDLILARLFLAEGRPRQALRLLKPLLPTMEEQGRVGLVIEILMLQALAHQAEGDREAALQALARSLALAEPGGYVRLFADEGPPMAKLLTEELKELGEQGGLKKLKELKELGKLTELRATAHDCRPSMGYVEGLLAAFGQARRRGDQAPSVPSTPPVPPVPSLPLLERLSERELEVLALIAEGLSNQEVAGRLFITLSTVKWHTSNIYGKLGVRSRTEAVARAGDLGILPARGPKPT